jgi:hypothetical protein
MKNLQNSSTQTFVRVHWKSLIPALFACLLRLSSLAPVPDSPAIEAKAKALVAKLTLEEKVPLPKQNAPSVN